MMANLVDPNAFSLPPPVRPRPPETLAPGKVAKRQFRCNGLRKTSTEAFRIGGKEGRVREQEGMEGGNGQKGWGEGGEEGDVAGG